MALFGALLSAAWNTSHAPFIRYQQQQRFIEACLELRKTHGCDLVHHKISGSAPKGRVRLLDRGADISREVGTVTLEYIPKADHKVISIGSSQLTLHHILFNKFGKYLISNNLRSIFFANVKDRYAGYGSHWDDRPSFSPFEIVDGLMKQAKSLAAMQREAETCHNINYIYDFLNR